MCRLHGDMREPLRIQAFYIRLALREKISPPETDRMKLVYLPSTSGSPLELNDEWVLPGDLAIAKLFREIKAESGGDAVYGSADKVTAGEGAVFEVHIGEVAAVKGRFLRRGMEWKMECWRGAGVAGIDRADVYVAMEDNIAIMERVEMVEKKKKRFCTNLERIPEEGEEFQCECCREDEGEDDDGWQMVGYLKDDDEDDDVWGEKVLEGEREVMTWAMDLGIWAVCLGVGFLVSRASSSSFSSKRRRRGFSPF